MPVKYLEDFWAGEVIRTRGRTVDIGDITAFAGLTGDMYPLHTNEEYARGTMFGTRIAHGPLTFSIAIGQVAQHGWYADAIVALLECRSLKALAPVKPGDTISVRATVRDVVTVKPKYGELHVEYDVINQREESVMKFDWIMLAHRRPEES
ncbi:MaoC/PaaZ C-terminal domain-containing protein [Streptomyces sp. NPDC005336]|uniref:MaoC/PaaZ C-terminal domain-containing protein n=1 Tax=Streptomyces sp. NPDC005336 TaxID=3157035 RepID=UPI0033ADB8FA